MASSPEVTADRRRNSLRSLIVIAVIGVVAAVILIFRHQVRGPTDPEGFLESVVDKRDDVALVAYTVAADGSPDPSDPVIVHNGDELMPLAGIARIPVLLAYAEAIAAGDVHADEAVSVSAWERHYLPGTDGGGHAKALRAFNVPAETGGFAVSPDAHVKLDQVVAAMIEHGDHSAGDFLLARLGEDRVDRATQAAGLDPHDGALPMSGLFLAASALQDEEATRSLLAQGQAAVAQKVHEAAAKFDAEYAGKSQHKIWMERYPTPPGGVQAIWSDQAMPRGTARDYAALLASVARGAWSTPEDSAIVARHLSWPMALEGNAGLFTAFAGKGGTLSSVMTESFYVTPKNGDFAGKTRVVVLLQRRMSMLRWLSTVRSFIHQHFMLKLAVERPFAEATAKALSK